MPGGESDDLAEKLLIHLAQDVGREDGEFVGAFGIVKPVDDVFQRFVVNGDVRREFVRIFVTVFLPLKMEQPGVVPVVGLTEELHEPFVDVRAVQLHLEPAVFLDAPVFADAQEYDPVYRPLNSEVQLPRRKIGVPESNVPGEQVAPVLDLGEEGVVNGRGPLFEPALFRILVEGALEHGLA